MDEKQQPENADGGVRPKIVDRLCSTSTDVNCNVFDFSRIRGEDYRSGSPHQQGSQIGISFLADSILISGRLILERVATRRRPAPEFSYGTTELTEVPQLEKPFLVPPHVPFARLKAAPVQFGYWM